MITNTDIQCTPTSIKVDLLEELLHNHPDREFVSYLINGCRNGFDTGIKDLPSTNFICKNLLSARTQSDVARNLVQSELRKGFLIGPFETIPWQNYRINPIGIAEGKYSKKKRLIVDLSAPHNDSENHSLNDLINKEEFSLQYVTLDNAIQIIKQKGQGSWLCKVDISDAFKLIPIHQSLWPFHGIQWDNLYFFYTRLVFGSRSSPKIFDTLSSALCWIATHHYGIDTMLHLLDDFLTIDPPDFVAERTMALLTLMFNRLGVPLAKHKCVGPTTCLEYLGIILDTAKMEARLPDDKRQRICDILGDFINKRTCTKRQLLSLLGHLNFACRVIHPGRSFISYLIKLSTTVKELHHHVKISAECRLDLSMWYKFLSGWNGVSFFLHDNIEEAADLHLFTDSTDRAFAGIYHNQWFQGIIPQAILEGEETVSMAFCELYPIVMSCVLWGSTWGCKRLLFHCDNLGTVNIITKGRSKSSLIMRLMRKLTWISAVHNFTVHAKHLPSRENSIADAISRFQMEKFRQLKPTADTVPTPCIPMEELLRI